MTTYFTTKLDALSGRRWWLLDATDLTLGRLSSVAARLLMGKNKPTWTPSVDDGDFVVIVNCEQVALTGRKEQRKMLHHYSGYPGGMKSVTAGKLRATRPERLVEESIKGMLPKTRLGRAMAGKMKVYAGPQHPHAAQAPVPFEHGLRKMAKTA